MEQELIRKVTNDVEADTLIEEIKEAKAELQRVEMIATAKIQNINNALEQKRKAFDYVLQQNQSMLQAYFLTIKPKETKTQKSYGLLSGKLVMKKPVQKIAHDDKKIMAWATDYIKQVPQLDWSKLKEDIEIDGEQLINKATGEVVSDLEGISLEQVGEVFEVKL